MFNWLNYDTRQHCILMHTLHYLLKETSFKFFLFQSNMISPRHSNLVHWRRTWSGETNSIDTRIAHVEYVGLRTVKALACCSLSWLKNRRTSSLRTQTSSPNSWLFGREPSSCCELRNVSSQQWWSLAPEWFPPGTWCISLRSATQETGIASGLLCISGEK